MIDWELTHIGDPREDLGWCMLASVAVPLAWMHRLAERPAIPNIQLTGILRSPGGESNP